MVKDHAAPRLRTTVVSHSPEQTRAIAASLGALCRGGEILLLRGDLGSGKTCFVQGLATSLGISPNQAVVSPTFTLHAEYPGRLILNHLDLYRLDAPEALEFLGVAEMLFDPGAVTAIEWPELLDGLAGDERLEAGFSDPGGGRRELDLIAFGERHVRLLDSWLDNARADGYSEGTFSLLPPNHRRQK